MIRSSLKGITEYADERHLTQGRAIAITGFAGTLWRSHLAVVEKDGTVEKVDEKRLELMRDEATELGQTEERQVNCFGPVNELRATLGRAFSSSMFSAPVFEEKDAEELFEREMRVGLQEDTAYTGRWDGERKQIKPFHFDNPHEPRLMTQVFASGIPNPQAKDLSPRNSISHFYRNFLRAQYRATFAAALNNALRNSYKQNSGTLYLTALGARDWPELRPETEKVREYLFGILHDAIADSLYAYRNCGLVVVFLLPDKLISSSSPQAKNAKTVQQSIESRIAEKKKEGKTEKRTGTGEDGKPAYDVYDVYDVCGVLLDS
eukprot:g11333.t1